MQIGARLILLRKKRGMDDYLIKPSLNTELRRKTLLILHTEANLDNSVLPVPLRLVKLKILTERLNLEDQFMKEWKRRKKKWMTDSTKLDLKEISLCLPIRLREPTDLWVILRESLQWE